MAEKRRIIYLASSFSSIVFCFLEGRSRSLEISVESSPLLKEGKEIFNDGEGNEGEVDESFTELRTFASI